VWLWFLFAVKSAESIIFISIPAKKPGIGMKMGYLFFDYRENLSSQA